MYETIGRARLDAESARALAEAVERGREADPGGGYLAMSFERQADAIRERHPSYDPLKHAAGLVDEWNAFAAFARKGGFRIDLCES